MTVVEKLFTRSDKLKGQNDPKVNPARSVLTLHKAAMACVNIYVYIKVILTQLLLSGYSWYGGIWRNKREQWAMIWRTFVPLYALWICGTLTSLPGFQDPQPYFPWLPGSRLWSRKVYLLTASKTSHAFVPSYSFIKMSSSVPPVQVLPRVPKPVDHTNLSHLWTAMNCLTEFAKCIACNVCTFCFPNYIHYELRADTIAFLLCVLYSGCQSTEYVVDWNIPVNDLKQGGLQCHLGKERRKGEK